MELTLREVDVLLRQMDIRVHNNIALKASFHGIKIPTKEVQAGPQKTWTEEEHDRAVKAMQNSMKRLKNKARMKQAKGG